MIEALPAAISSALVVAPARETTKSARANSPTCRHVFHHFDVAVPSCFGISRETVSKSDSPVLVCDSQRIAKFPKDATEFNHRIVYRPRPL